MKRGTTPTLEIAVDGVKVTDLSSIYVTLKQDDLIITKSGKDIQVNEEDNSLGVSLSQKETLFFALDSFTCRCERLQTAEMPLQQMFKKLMRLRFCKRG